jgi:hypothetical protein
MAWEVRKAAETNYVKAKPQKSKPYLHWLHALPCCVSGRHGVQAAHVSFAAPWYGNYGRGKGTKVADLFAVPLHPEEHARQHAMNEEQFWREAGVDPHQLANTLWAIHSAYPEHEATIKATARINQGLALAGRLPSRDSA